MQIKNKIKDILLSNNKLKLVSHYYVHPDLQDMAEETNGFIGDSLGMAKWANVQKCETIIVAGVHFMAETIKILNPTKNVILLDEGSTCSLDVGCSYDAFKEFQQSHLDRVTVVYANTSAKIKTLADWVVTSRNAIEIVDYLDSEGKKILWAPDKHMGAYVAKTTGADIISWEGSCTVHDQFKHDGILSLKQSFPEAKVLAHPEAPINVTNISDLVGSTEQMIKYTKDNHCDTYIIASDSGLFYQMQKASPMKKFIQAPTGGYGATCKMCAQCPWMGLNNLELLWKTLNGDAGYHVDVAKDISKLARIPLDRMLNF